MIVTVQCVAPAGARLRGTVNHNDEYYESVMATY